MFIPVTALLLEMKPSECSGNQHEEMELEGLMLFLLALLQHSQDAGASLAQEALWSRPPEKKKM